MKGQLHLWEYLMFGSFVDIYHICGSITFKAADLVYVCYHLCEVLMLGGLTRSLLCELFVFDSICVFCA